MTGRLFPFQSLPVAVAALFCAAIAVPLPAQEPGSPFEKAALLTAIRINGISPAEIVEYINKRGLAFRMSVADEQEFRQAGATDLIIETLWEKENFEIKQGPPLTEEGIIESLQAGVPPRRLERMIRVRFAKVTLSREVADRIKAAGGTDSLLGTIVSNPAPPPPPPPPTTVPVTAAAPEAALPPKPDTKKQYDDLIAKATEYRKEGNYLKATEVLTEAKRMDPKRPEAYAISGLIWMTSVGGVVRAGAEYSSALDRDGDITIPMVHLHGHTATLKEKSCRGTMTVSHAAVTYSSPTGHRYTIETGRIKEAAVDSSKLTLGALGGNFRITWIGATGREEEHFRVDIEKDNREADRIMVELIRKSLVH